MAGRSMRACVRHVAAGSDQPWVADITSVRLETESVCGMEWLVRIFRDLDAIHKQR